MRRDPRGAVHLCWVSNATRSSRPQPYHGFWRLTRYIHSPPGGEYEHPPPIHAPTATEHYTTAVPAQPTHEGTTESCGKYTEVRAGDSCSTVVFRE